MLPKRSCCAYTNRYVPLKTEKLQIDNLNIGIAEYGDPSGVPVFYFHGFPGSRLDGELFDFDVKGKEFGIRLIGIDRPGFGKSDFQPNRKLLDWPETVLSIANHLSLERFSILGISGGAPYALSCAHGIPNKLNCVAVVAGMGPYHYKESIGGQAMMIPKQIGIVRWLIALGMKAGARKNPDKLKKNILSQMPHPDKEYLSDPLRLDCLIQLFNEAFKQGLKGYLHEAKIYKRSWGFNVSDISKEITMWHGTDDNNVPIELAKRIALELPNCESTFMDNEGHFSLPGNHLSSILETIKIKDRAHNKT